MLVADGEQANGFGGEMLKMQILPAADSLSDELFLFRCERAEFGTFRSGGQVPVPLVKVTASQRACGAGLLHSMLSATVAGLNSDRLQLNEHSTRPPPHHC